MTNRLPIIGEDSGTWGEVLNSFLAVSLYNNSSNLTDPNNGTLNPNSVNTSQIVTNAVTNAQLDTPTQTMLASVASKYVKPTGGIPSSDLAGNIPVSALATTGTANISTYLTGAGTWSTPAAGLTLDSTASDIQPDTVTGTAEVGSTGKAADAGHQHPLVSHTHNTASQGGQLNPTTALSSTGSPSTTTFLRGDNSWSSLPAGTTTLASDTDVSVSGMTNGQVLTYNTTANKWVNQAVPSASNATSSVPGLVELNGDLAPGSSGATNPEVTSTHLSSALPLTQGGTGSTTQNFVDLSTSQTIAGTKTFSSTIAGNISGNAATATTATTASTVTTIPALSGDVISSGSSNVTSVAKLSGISLPGTAPSASGQVLTTISSTSTSWSTPAAGVTLDSSSTDIQPLGTRSAGSVGKAADAGHVHAMPNAVQVGALSSNEDLSAISTTNATAANVSLNSFKITNLANGINATDAATFGQIPLAGTTAGTYVAGNDTRIIGALQTSNNLSELTATASTARTNLGLGSAATQPTSAFDTAGAATAAQNSSLQLTGGTMSGAIAMASHKITGLTNGSASADAVAYGQLGSAAFDNGPASTIVGISDTQTILNKRITKRVVIVTQSATPAVNTDNTDVASLTGLAQGITSMSSNLTGTPVDGDSLIVRITDNGTAQTIAWGTTFEASIVALPTTTVASIMLMVGFIWHTTTSAWRCVAVA